MLTVAAGGETVTLPDPIVAAVLHDFTANGGTVGAMLPASVSDAAFTIAAGSSTKAGMVNALPQGATNPLYLLRTARGVPALTLAGLTVMGTSQGHLYGGLMIDHCDGAQLADSLFRAIPGAGASPPTETFFVNVYGGDGVTLTRVEVDGAGVGASGIGVNSATNVELDDCYVHDCPYGMPTFWQTAGITTRALRSVNNHLGVNHERCTGPIRHHELQCHVAAAAGQMHMTLNNDQADNADVEIHLSDWSGGHYGANSPFCFAMGDRYRGVANQQVTVPRFFGLDGAPMQVADAGSPTHPAVNVAAAKADPRHWVVRFR